MSYDPIAAGAECSKCPLKGSVVVPPEGPLTAELAVVGEAPGWNEEREKRPFIGASGFLLNGLLKQNSLPREAVFITNATLCRPPEIRIGQDMKTDTKKQKAAVACCRPRLLREFKVLPQLQVVAPLGAIAVRAVTGRKNLSIQASRGFIWKVDATKAHVIPSVHPAFVLRAPAWQAVITSDFERAVRISRGNIDLPLVDMVLAPPIEQLEAALAKLDRVVGVDIETTRLGATSCTMLCVGISDGIRAVVIPWASTGSPTKPFYGRHQGGASVVLRKALLSRVSVTHNGPGFDQVVLRRYGVELTDGEWEDTLLAHHAFASHFPQRLDHVVSMYLDAPPWKIVAKKPGKQDEKGAWDPGKLRDEELWTYNALDAAFTARAWRAMESDLAPERSVYEEDKTLAQLCRGMQEHGVAVDSARREELRRELRGRQNYYLGKMRAAVGFEVRPTVLDHLRKALFKVLHAPVLYRSSTGLASTGVETLQALARIDSAAGRFCRYVLKWREAWKLRSTYVDGIKPEADDRVHPSWRAWGTVTGRLSCIAKGTPIEVLRDVAKYPKGIPIEDVRAGDVAYTFDKKGRLRLRRVTWAGKTGTRKVVRLHWRGSGHHHVGYLDLTPEHRVRLVSGKYVRADKLRPGDRVAALSRGVTNGYARLWATGHAEIPREHRFVLDKLVGNGRFFGRAFEHIHHVNGNKLDNRLTNLVGLRAPEHTQHHARDPNPELRRKRSVNAKARYENGTSGLKPLRGAANPRWLGLKRTPMLRALRAHRWSVTKTCRALGHDFNTFKSHLVRLGFDLTALRRRNRQARRSEIVVGVAHARQARQGKLYNHEVLRVEALDLPVDVYDLTVDKDRNFIAGEICVHNCREPNLQNLKRGSSIRSMYIAQKGHTLVGADFSQLEMRIAAYLSGDETFIAACESGDLHTANAKQLFGDELPDKATHPEEFKRLRTIAKSAGFAVNYLATAETVHARLQMEGLSVSLQQVIAMLDRLRRVYKRYFEWQAEQLQQVQELGYIRLPLSGRRRWLGHEPMPTEVANCCDAETEALTDHGWVRGFDLKPGDKLLTKNAQTGLLEWHPATRVQKFPNYRGPLVEFKSRSFNAVTTPDHRWLVTSKNSRRTECRTTKEIGVHGSYRIHRTGAYAAPTTSPYTNDFVELVGWFLTDGSAAKKQVRVSLSQSMRANPKKVARIDRLLWRLGVRANRHVRQDGTEAIAWTMFGNTNYVHLLRRLFPQRTLTSEFLMQLSTPQLRLLLKTMMLGDGHCEREGKSTFATRYKTGADAFQFLCTLCGIASTSRWVDMSKYRPRSPKLKNIPKMTGIWIVNLLRRTTAQVLVHPRAYGKATKRIVQRREFTAARPVWCPVVRNTYFVARRAGAVYVTGNTPIQGGAADVMNRMLPALVEQLPRGSRLVAQVHDSVIVECDSRFAPRVEKLLKHVMETPVEFGGRMVIFPAEVKSGARWSEVA